MSSDTGAWCMQVQRATLMASSLDLGLPEPDITALWQAAADEERRDTLFAHIATAYI